MTCIMISSTNVRQRSGCLITFSSRRWSVYRPQTSSRVDMGTKDLRGRVLGNVEARVDGIAKRQTMRQTFKLMASIQIALQIFRNNEHSGVAAFELERGCLSGWYGFGKHACHRRVAITSLDLACGITALPRHVLFPDYHHPHNTCR